MKPRYIVSEVQQNSEQEMGSIQNQTFDNTPEGRANAEQRFHQVCAAAVKSAKPLHTVVWWAADGTQIEVRSFGHVVEPEPAPEPDAETEAE